MSFTYSRAGDNAIYTLNKVVGSRNTHQVFDQYYYDYIEVGSALGIVIDVRGMTRLSMRGSQAAYKRLKDVRGANLPVAFIGKPDSFLLTFVQMLEVIGKRSVGRITFHDTLEAGLAWLNEWHAKRGQDRDALRGHLAVKLPPPRGLQDK